MDWAIAAVVFPVIALGELPGKAMFASLVLSTKGSPRAVWGRGCRCVPGPRRHSDNDRRGTVPDFASASCGRCGGGDVLAGAALALREGVRECRLGGPPAPLMAHGRTITAALVGSVTTFLPCRPFTPVLSRRTGDITCFPAESAQPRSRQQGTQTPWTRSRSTSIRTGRRRTR